MPWEILKSRGVAAIGCLLVLVGGALPAGANAPDDDKNAAMALVLFNNQTCGQRANRTETFQPNAVAQATASPPPSPESSASPPASASPGPVTTPGLPGSQPGTANSTFQLYATPRPRPGESAPAQAPPIPTPSPNASPASEPIFLIRGGETPPPLTPAGNATPAPTPVPTGAPTLEPGYVAVIADKVTGGTKKGEPGDAIGNVHIYYGDEEIVGDKAHFDGVRTVTITGHPFLINHTHDSILTADVIDFDTLAETAKLLNGNGESAQGVERGFVHFKANDLHTDPDGSAHGNNPSVTTCENPRAGYHITGKTMDVIPGDKIVINKAILWLGAAAIFYLPRLVIPLRSVQDQRARPHWFPEVGYDSYEGAWIKFQVPFGKDQYYYGYYIVNYFTKAGLGLGYVGFYSSKRGRRTVSINFYGMNDRLAGQRTYNIAAQEQENFSQHLRGNFQFGYQSNYGALTNIPPNETLSGAIVHQTQNTSQNYSYSHSSVGTQSNSNSFSFTDTRQFNSLLNQSVSFNMSNSSSNFGEASFNATAEFDYLMHYTTTGADYQFEYDKTFAQEPFGIDKVPEVQVRPYDFFSHFIFPISAQLTFGEYSEPTSQLATWRGDAGLVFGPALAKVWGSDFEATVNVDQYAYGTGDLKAAIEQDLSLTTPIGSHIVNSLTYNESNYNGPALVPFQYLDQQPTENTKNAQDLIRFFNDDVYSMALGFSTNFDGFAQPVSYQITARPSARSVVLLSGSFIPGPGQGFETTNLQLSTPFGRDASIQFVTDLQWKGPEFFANKIIYYTRTIGNCYQVQVLYSEASQSVNVGLSLLAFPNQTETFSIGQSGSIVPSTFNF
ncbi:MAG TPA: hypothetical protein VIJ77_00705 [Candidatus Tumulicola sp.]